MHNLEEIQQNLKLLVQQLQQIKLKSKGPVLATTQNSTQPLIKIPKAILLTKICPFLTNSDIVSLSTACRNLRKTVYGPFGWKILSFQLTRCPIIIKQIDSSDRVKDTYEVNWISNEDQKYLKKERDKYKQILVNKFEQYIKSKERYEGHLQKLRGTKNQLMRKRFENSFLQGNRKSLQNGNSQYKQKLKNLSQGFVQRIKRLDSELDQLHKDNTKLQNQKQALAGKVRQYQYQIEKVKIESERSKQILKKLKNYLLYKQL